MVLATRYNNIILKIINHYNEKLNSEEDWSRYWTFGLKTMNDMDEEGVYRWAEKNSDEGFRRSFEQNTDGFRDHLMEEAKEKRLNSTYDIYI